MANTAATSPGTLANDASGGFTSWTNPSNAAASDNTYAVASGLSVTQYLKATNFGFAIPGGATIDGIVVEIEMKRAGGFAFQYTIQLVKGGTVGGTNKSTGASVAGSDTIYTFGGAADLWGNALTDSDVNASNFGVVLQLSNGGKGAPDASVDHIRMTVYYTGGGGGVSIPVIVNQYRQRSA